MDLSPDIQQEDIDVFLQESEEQLELLDEDLVRLEQEEDNNDLLQEIFRAAHTIKGSAGMIGFHQMADLAHWMENLLDLVRQGVVAVSTAVVDPLLSGLDLLRTMKEDLAQGQDTEVDISAVVAQLEELAEASGAGSGPKKQALVELKLDARQEDRLRLAVDGGSSAYWIAVAIDPESPWNGVRCFQILDGLAENGEVIASSPTQADIEDDQVSVAVQVVMTSERDADFLQGLVSGIDDVLAAAAGVHPREAPIHEVLPILPAPTAADTSLEVTADTSVGGGGSGPGSTAAAPEQAKAASGSSEDNRQRTGQQQSQTLRVDVERLDNLMTTIGELVIDRTRISQIGRQLQAKYHEDALVQSLGETAAHVVKVVDDLQQEIMEVRMLPVGTVFNGFPRMVRDLAQRFDKKVDFVVEGQDTEIDRTVVERIRDPLVHLLRNSIDHGMEMPDERVGVGKPEKGTIRLAAAHEQGHIVITVSDDGRGIDPEAIKQGGIKKGIVTPEVAGRLTDNEAIDLIFAPGYSTAESTTDVSGRGVGMDIVKTNIESINGFVTVDTKVGEGTTFNLRLPLTLATLQALLVSLENTIFAVPVVYVIEVRRVNVSEIETIEGNEVIRSRGEIVPILRLDTAFARGTVISDRVPEPGDEEQHVVVVSLGGRLVGIAMESLLELQEIMVKSLEASMGNIKGIAGASILGDGQVVLILDVPTLIQTTLGKGKLLSAAAEAAAV